MREDLNQNEQTNLTPEEIKAQKIAAAKARAAQLKAEREAAKAGGTTPAPTEETASSEASALSPEEEKAQKIAAAKAKAAQLKAEREAAKAGGSASIPTEESSNQEASGLSPEEEKAQKIAAAKAKAAALKAARESGESEATAKATEPETPSPKQPQLDLFVKKLQNAFGENIVENAFINRYGKDVPTLEVKKEDYLKIITLLKEDEELKFDSMHELHGTDFKTYIEVYVNLFSYSLRHTVVVKTKLDRDEPVVASLAPLYPAADWPERETYDLLGVTFTDHPNLTRILLPDDWIGYPLRKDYEPHDVEV
ncbi:MAG: NADH-quinone oxidoreductase subunit C [Bacilli bacterium]